LVIDRKNFYEVIALSVVEKTTVPIKTPIKTKIAALWIILIGVVLIIFGAGLSVSVSPDGPGPILFLLLGFSIGLLLFFPPGLFLFQKKKIGWYWAIILLLVAMTILVYSSIDSYIYYLHFEERCPYEYTPTGEKVCMGAPDLFNVTIPLGIIAIFLLPPFILLFLDRKNFWKIAT